MTGLIVALVLFPLIGIAIGRIAGPVQPWLAGAGATGAILFIANALHVPLLVAVSLLIVAAIVVVLIKPALPREPIRFDLPTAIAAIMVMLLLAVALAVPLDDYDGRAFWLLKAKAIAHERSVDGPFFRQQASFSPRNQYPLLVPIDAALLMIAGRELDDRQARGLFILFAAAFALEIRRRLGAWTAAIFLCLPAVVSPAGGALSAGSDIALAAFAGCAFFEIAGKGSPARAGMWLSFVALTKSEGLPLSILLLLIATAIFRRRAAIAAAPLSIAIAVLLTWRSRIPRSDEPPFAQLIFDLPRHASAFRIFLVRLLQQAVTFDLWGLMWIAFVAAIVVVAIRRDWRTLALTLTTFVPMLVLYAAVVAVSGWDASILTGVATRLVTHLLGPALFLYAAAVSLLDRMPNERL